MAYRTVHFAATTRNFWMTETKLPQSDSLQQMGDAPGLKIEDGEFQIPTGPGLGVTLHEDAIFDMLIEGEKEHWK